MKKLYFSLVVEVTSYCDRQGVLRACDDYCTGKILEKLEVGMGFENQMIIKFFYYITYNTIQ